MGGAVAVLVANASAECVAFIAVVKVEAERAALRAVVVIVAASAQGGRSAAAVVVGKAVPTIAVFSTRAITVAIALIVIFDHAGVLAIGVALIPTPPVIAVGVAVIPAVGFNIIAVRTSALIVVGVAKTPPREKNREDSQRKAKDKRYTYHNEGSSGCCKESRSRPLKST